MKDYRSPEGQLRIARQLQAAAAKIKRKRKAVAVFVMAIHKPDDGGVDAVICSGEDRDEGFTLENLADAVGNVAIRILHRAVEEATELKH